MNKPSKKSIDQAFSNTFETYETEFVSSDWDNMLNQLEESDDIIVPPIPTTNHPFTNKKNTLIMILIATLTSAIFWASSPTIHETQKPVINTVTTELSEASVDNTATDKPFSSDFNIKTKKVEMLSIKTADSQSTISPNQSNLRTAEVISPEKIVEKLNSIDPVEPPSSSNKVTEKVKTVEKVAEKLVSVVDTAKFLKKVVSKYWVDTTYKYIYEKPSRDVEEGWFGLYYTHQMFTDNADWVNIGRNEENSGFNIQMMSGNLLPGENIAIYGGFDWGMQFLGRSEDSEVILNTVKEDRGLTYLRSHTNDLFITGHFEYTQLPIVPYLSMGFGARINSTGQTTRSLLTSTEYESSDDNGVYTRAALATKFGLGVKVKIAPRVYLDARYELIQTNKINTVDYSASTYNGLSYDVGLKKMNLSADQFRFGIVFDVSEETSKKVIDKPGYWEEQEQTLYVDPSDSSKVFVPCPCDKPKKTKRTSRTHSPANQRSFPNDNRRSGGGIFSPGSSGGGGKSPFPGTKTKTPPITW